MAQSGRTPSDQQPPEDERSLGIEAIAALFIAISLFMPLLPVVAEFAVVSLFVIPWLLMGALPFIAVALVVASVFRSDDTEWDPQEGYAEANTEADTAETAGSSPIESEPTDTTERSDDASEQPQGDPLEVLKERFATGEITIEEYERGLELIVDVDDPAEGLRRVSWLDDDETEIFGTERLAEDPFEYVDEPEQIKQKADAAAKRDRAVDTTSTRAADDIRTELEDSQIEDDTALSNEQLDAIAAHVVERLERERERERE